MRLTKGHNILNQPLSTAQMSSFIIIQIHTTFIIIE